MKGTVSVIIPVLNGGHMLKACTASVTGSCVAEIVIVDDGSTDDTLQIAQQLAEADTRIRVVHTENHGIYEARRAGIAVSTAPYITSLDADDRYCKGALDTLVHLLETHSADIAFGGIVETDSPDAAAPVTAAPTVREQSPEQMWKRLMRWGTQEFIMYVGHKLYRRELLTALIPADGICQGEDVLITCQAFLHAKKIVETTVPVYLYYQNPESMLHAKFSRRDLDLIRVWERAVRLMPQGKLKYMAKVNRWRTDYTLMTRLILADDKALDTQFAEELKVWRKSLAAHWKALVRLLPPARKLLVLGLRFAYTPTKAALRLAVRIKRRLRR